MEGCTVKPSRTSDQLRRAEIAQIHIAKSQLGMDDDTYRAMLWSVGRVRSSSDLDWRGRKAVLDHLKRSGFKVQAKPQTRRLDLDAESQKARKLWLLLGEAGELRDTSERALAAYVHRVAKVDDLRFTNGKQIERVIESLKKWCSRVWRRKLGEAIQARDGLTDEALENAVVAFIQSCSRRGTETFEAAQAAWDTWNKVHAAT
jgi:phage gp16-like protein